MLLPESKTLIKKGCKDMVMYIYIDIDIDMHIYYNIYIHILNLLKSFYLSMYFLEWMCNTAREIEAATQPQPLCQRSWTSHSATQPLW